MIYCNYCGYKNSDKATFCGNCGRPLATKEQHEGASSTNQNQNTSSKSGSWFDSLNDYVGNDRPADLNWTVLFSDVFKSHSVEEAEDIFICGTHHTTPSASEVSKDWPHPWLYSRVLFMFGIAFALLWVCCDMFQNYNALPGLIVVGSFAVPLSTMILFLEVNAWRNVSFYKVIQTFLVGGCASLVATLMLFDIVGNYELDFFGAFMTGVVEELGKAVIVYWFLRKLGKLSILSGLLIGSCVGAGFAAFESAGYALQPFTQIQQMVGYAAAYGQNYDTQQLLDAINGSIFVRGILAPGGHVAWAAISGAALVIAAKANGKIDTSLFADGKFLRLFIIPVILHGLWDSPLAGWLYQIFPYLGYILLIVFVWIVVLILINMGLAEVSKGR